MVHGNEQEFFAEDVVEDADERVEDGGLADFGPGDREDVADEHVFEVLGFARGFAHQQDGHGGSHGVGDTDEGFLRDVAATGACEGEDRGAQESKSEADPVGTAPMRVHTDDDRDSRAEGGDLREREIDENYPALHDVHPEVRVNASEDQAGYKRGNEKGKNLHRRISVLLGCV